MANKLKETVPYFPFFVADGRTFFVLKKRYGALGIGYFTELFRLLARTPGHVFSMRDDFDRERLTDFIGSKEHPANEADMFEFLDLLASTGKIDPDLWTKKRLIVSADFLETLQEAYRRRKAECPTIETVREEYKSLQDIEYSPPANEYVVNMTAICRQYDGNMTATPAQSKVKKSKVKKSKPIGESFDADASIVPALNNKSESELYNKIKAVFEKEQPKQRFTDYGKEGKAIKGLIKKGEDYDPEDVETFIFGMIAQYRELRQFDKFYQKQPFTPSALNSSGIFDRVLNEAKIKWESNMAVTYEEILF
jgi:hypothetical protein